MNQRHQAVLLRERITPQGRHTQSHLVVYALLGAKVDNYLLVLESVGDTFEGLEEEMA